MDRGKLRSFKQKVKRYYKKHGRHDLPWRATTNPYHILVSEVMLQQTQVPRVIPKYTSFLKRFPTTKSLARAPFRDVLQIWTGLGYNRRARMLQQTAQHIEANLGGVFPKQVAELEVLPGIGPYTARAVAAFAYNNKVVMIETNIRTVFLHEFFIDATDVSDREVMRYIEALVAHERSPREWYAALMDYGTYLKQTIGNPNTKSKHYIKQSKFKGSLREIRGKILPLLMTSPQTTQQIQKLLLDTAPEKVTRALQGLERDGLIVLSKRKWKLAT